MSRAAAGDNPRAPREPSTAEALATPVQFLKGVGPQRAEDDQRGRRVYWVRRDNLADPRATKT